MHYAFIQVQQQEVVALITYLCKSLSAVYGNMPRHNLHVAVKPIGKRSDDPVPWAQVNRGDPNTVSFYIDGSASRSRLLHNWTAYHEFSHLLLPYQGYGDLWFSEGLASYYQNILQLRAGKISEQEFWKKLDSGFKRGQADDAFDHLSLAELSPRMRETRSFMRAYWSGAMMYLLADIELRRSSNGQESLDSALGALNRCCADRAMSAQQIAAKLDELLGRDLFQSSFNRFQLSTGVPEYASIYERLGISINGGSIMLSDSAPMSAIRKQIENNWH
jgi:hypothetical protein